MWVKFEVSIVGLPFIHNGKDGKMSSFKTDSAVSFDNQFCKCARILYNKV
jgi:hypothetical protein